MLSSLFVGCIENMRVSSIDPKFLDFGAIQSFDAPTFECQLLTSRGQVLRNENAFDVVIT